MSVPRNGREMTDGEDKHIATQSGWPRQRTWKPKVRTGCQTCKQRRVKCDETRPACLRCTKTGRKCDGYGSGMAIQVVDFVLGNSSEKRALQFFYEKTAPHLSDYFDAPFWNNFLMRQSRVHPAIKHGLMALGAAYESTLIFKGYMENHAVTAPDTLCLQEVNKSISLLTADPENVPLSVILMSSILFYHLGFLMPRTGSVTHMNQALRIVQEYKEKQGAGKPHPLLPPGEIDLVENHIIPLLTRIGGSLGSMLDPAHAVSQQALFRGEVELPPEREQPRLPKSFNDLYQAKEGLTPILEWTLERKARQVHDGTYEAGEPLDPDLRAQYKKWEALLDDFLAKQGRQNPQSAVPEGACLLRLYSYFAQLIARCINAPNETCFDGCNEAFQEIVDLSDQFFALVPDDVPDAAPKFAIDLSVLRPLQFTALRCREPSIRRQALKALLGTLREEGGHCGRESGLFVMAIIEMEEEGLGNIKSCKDIAEENRIRLHGMATHYSVEKEVITLRYTRAPYDEELGAKMEVAHAYLSPAFGRPVGEDQVLLKVTYPEPGHEDDFPSPFWFWRNKLDYYDPWKPQGGFTFNASVFPFLPRNLNF